MLTILLLVLSAGDDPAPASDGVSPPIPGAAAWSPRSEADEPEPAPPRGWSGLKQRFGLGVDVAGHYLFHWRRVGSHNGYFASTQSLVADRDIIWSAHA